MKDRVDLRRMPMRSLMVLTAVAFLMAQTAVGADRRVLGEYFTQPN